MSFDSLNYKGDQILGNTEGYIFYYYVPPWYKKVWQWLKRKLK